MEIFTDKDEIDWKLNDQGLTSIFVGYSVNYANEVYRMLNLNTKRIIHIMSYNYWSKYKTPSIDKDEDENKGD
jgi:hypothetical protein